MMMMMMISDHHHHFLSRYAPRWGSRERGGLQWAHWVLLVGGQSVERGSGSAIGSHFGGLGVGMRCCHASAEDNASAFLCCAPLAQRGAGRWPRGIWGAHRPPVRPVPSAGPGLCASGPDHFVG